MLYSAIWLSVLQEEQSARHVYSSGANIVFPDILNDAKVVKNFQYINDVQRSYE